MEIVTGAEAGAGDVRVWAGLEQGTWLWQTNVAPNSNVGARVAVANVDSATGDSQGKRAEIIVAPARDSNAIRIYGFGLGAAGSWNFIFQRHVFQAYGTSYTGGIQVAAGDVDGDGVAEIITGNTVDGGVRVFTPGGTAANADGSIGVIKKVFSRTRQGITAEFVWARAMSMAITLPTFSSAMPLLSRRAGLRRRCQHRVHSALEHIDRICRFCRRIRGWQHIGHESDGPRDNLRLRPLGPYDRTAGNERKHQQRHLFRLQWLRRPNPAHRRGRERDQLGV